MLFRKQAMLGMWLSSVLTLLMLVIYCVNITSAQQLEAGASVNLKKLDKRATVEAYNTLLATAMRAFMKYLTDPSDTDALEKLVAMSNDFIAAHPLSERIGEVYYYLGKALVRLGRVETGIATLEKLIKDTPPDRVDVKYYSGGIGYGLRWHHRRQFSDFSNMRNALQSRRDYMFIAPNVLNLFRSVGAIFL